MAGLRASIAWREHFVVDNREIVVPHEYWVGSVLAVVAMGEIAVAVHVHVAVARDEQVGAGPEDRPDVRVMAYGEGLFYHVILGGRRVLVVYQGEEKSFVRGDVVVAFGRGFAPGYVTEATADLAPCSWF